MYSMAVYSEWSNDLFKITLKDRVLQGSISNDPNFERWQSFVLAV